MNIPKNTQRGSALPPLRRKGFTLIELLTVIAIIGILAAIMIPVVGKVREKARAVDCVSRLRAIGTATAVFAGDNKDRLPTNGADEVFTGSTRGRMYYLLAPYIVPQAKAGTNLRPLKYFMCPTFDSLPSPDFAQHYGYNIMISRRNATGTNFTNTMPTPIRMSQVKRPDTTPLGWDIAGEGGGSNQFSVNPKASEFGYSGPTDPGGLSPQHGKSCNMVFVSGRVSAADLSSMNNFPFNGNVPQSSWAPNTLFDPLYAGN